MTIDSILYGLNAALLFSGLVGFRLRSGERLFSMYLLQCLLGLPVLAGVYIYASLELIPVKMPLVLFAESVFAFIWACLAYWMYRAVTDGATGKIRHAWLGILPRFAVLAVGAYAIFEADLPDRIEDAIVFSRRDAYFFCACFLLLSAVAMGWRLENFWRGLSISQRWAYKYLLVGACLVCGGLVWITSYRLSYLSVGPDHFLLLAAILVLGWLFMVYAVGRHRLLNRKIYISRKIVYNFVAPLAFGIYLIGLGILIMIMRYLDLPMSYVLRWFLLVAGLSLAAVLTLSGSVRKRVKFFISTHFYVNKYEYRDEWLAFSRQLQGALSEAEIIGSLELLLERSLYTDMVCIWIGDEDRGYRLALSKGIFSPRTRGEALTVSSGDPIVRSLKTSDYCHLGEKQEPDLEGAMSSDRDRSIIAELGPVLFVPMISGEKLIGFIGLGPEISGGKYSHDDYDLLLALGTQAASAIQAGRMAEEISRIRQREAWNTMSSFVLHDVKNAASMLSLTRQNAKGHLDDPEFQRDLLEAIDDALKRMAKVQNLLGTLKGETSPALKETDLSAFLKDLKRHAAKRLPGLNVVLKSDSPIIVRADDEMLFRIMENLLINALEAGGDGTTVEISCRDENGKALVEVRDDGPGLPGDLPPDALFEPFRTTKPDGNGVGLWQVKRLAAVLGGEVRAENFGPNGAGFSVALPTVGKKSENPPPFMGILEEAVR